MIWMDWLKIGGGFALGAVAGVLFCFIFFCLEIRRATDAGLLLPLLVSSRELADRWRSLWFGRGD